VCVSHRLSRTHLPAAAEDEAGQESVCGGVCDWSGAADRWLPRRLSGGPGGGAKDRHMLSEGKAVCVSVSVCVCVSMCV
jgi:hypothetical protein